MAEKKKRSKRGSSWGLPFTTRNYFWITVGLVVIGLGYMSLAQGPADSFWSRTLAPVMLFIGYCFIIPLGILLKNRKTN